MEDVSQEEEKKETQPEAEKKPEEKEKSKEKFPALDRAEELKEAINAANKKHEELLNRQEALMAKQALGGKTDGGEIKTPEQVEQDKINAEVSDATTAFD